MTYPPCGPAAGGGWPSARRQPNGPALTLGGIVVAPRPPLEDRSIAISGTAGDDGAHAGRRADGRCRGVRACPDAGPGRLRRSRAVDAPDVGGGRPASTAARVYRLAYRLTGNVHDAEDLTQEVFVRVFRSLSTYTPGHLRGLAAPHHHQPVPGPGAAQEADPVRRAGRRRDRAAARPGARPVARYDDSHLDDDVQRALDALPPDFRAAVVLCDIEGLSYEEVAATLGIKLGTVRSRIHRGRAAAARRAGPPAPPGSAGTARIRRRGMIQRATGPQCLSSRVSALADGSLPDDVRDRALAHVTSCPDCRADLEAERLLRARLQALPAPRLSSSLVASLLAMAEPGGPLPPRAGHVPGTPRPAPATIRREPGVDAPWHAAGSLSSFPSLPSLPWHRATPGRRSTSRSPELPARPGPTSRPSGPSRLGRPAGPDGSAGQRATRRRAVGATAGAVGAGVIAAALASGLPAASPVATAERVHVQASTVGVAAAQPAAQRRGQDPRQVGGATGVDAVFSLAGTGGSGLWPSTPFPAGPGALPGVTTTLLQHLLASPASSSVGSATSVTSVPSVLVGRSVPGAAGSVAGERYLGFGFLAGPSR